MLLHALWNGSASLTGFHFLAVYALFMLPVFATLTWLAIWSRQKDLRTIRTVLTSYAAAGWLAHPEPWALGSMRVRAHARNIARRTHGPSGAQTVSEYHAAATSLALLRARTERGDPDPDFSAREQELLYHLLARRPLASPPTSAAALAHARPSIPPQWGGYGNPYADPQANPYCGPPTNPYGSHGSRP
jgi:protease PrsW